MRTLLTALAASTLALAALPALAAEDPGHIAAKRPGDRDHDRAEQRDLQPAIEGHGILLFRTARA